MVHFLLWKYENDWLDRAKRAIDLALMIAFGKNYVGLTGSLTLTMKSADFHPKPPFRKKVAPKAYEQWKQVYAEAEAQRKEAETNGEA